MNWTDLIVIIVIIGALIVFVLERRNSDPDIVIASGTCLCCGRYRTFTIVKCFHQPSRYEYYIVGCQDKKDARHRTTGLSMGLLDILHTTHASRIPAYYHFPDCYYFIFDDQPYTFVRIHFPYTPSCQKSHSNRKSSRNQIPHNDQSSFNQTSSLKTAKTVPMTPLPPFPNISYMYCVIDRGISSGKKYSIIKLPNSIEHDIIHDIDHKYLNCADRATAQEVAKKWSNGRDPVHHYAHEPRQRDHYHIFEHNYIIFDSHPDRFINIHFLYGQLISRKAFESRKNEILF